MGQKERLAGQEKLLEQMSGCASLLLDKIEQAFEREGVDNSKAKDELKDAIIRHDGNNAKLLELLKDVPIDKRTARFVSSVACVFPDGNYFTVRGECEGYIANEPKGTNGFGYDPLFVSELGCFGEISDSQKDSISHRGRSLEKLYEKLSEISKEEK